MWKEVLRVFGMIAAVDLGGGIIGALINASHALAVTQKISADFGAVVAGLVVGHLSGTVFVPLLWWKRIGRSLLWVFGPTAIAAVAGGYFMNETTATAAALFVYTGACVTAALRLPAEWESPRAGMCHRCGYSLRGNMSGRCPECGATPESPSGG